MQTDALVLAQDLQRRGLPERLTWGAVHLSVTDLPRTLRFWTEVLGFTLRPGPGVALGTEDRTLVVLHPGALIPVQRGHAGMYHVAFGVPSQAEFSRLLARFAQLRVPVSPVDHTMSKAIYLSDPDGHGIEIAFETPERFGRFQTGARGFAMTDSAGRLRSGRDPLDIPAELAEAEGADLMAPIAADTVVAHLHLHVPALAPALDWFANIGFARNLMLPQMGMADMGTGAAYTHRLALNIWAGEGVRPAPASSARLLAYDLITPDAALYDAARPQLGATAHGLTGTDPAGATVTLALRTAEPRKEVAA